MAVEDHHTCDICHYLEIDVDAKLTPEEFIAAAKQCSRCAAILRALQSVTDITRPEFIELQIEHGGEYLPKGVVQVRCIQQGVPVPGKLFNAFENPFPNRFSFYTPEGMIGCRIGNPGLRLFYGSCRLQLCHSWPGPP